MSTVVGLDLSLTSAGVAVLVDGRPKVIRSVGHKGRDGASYAQRSRRVRSQCGAVLDVLEKRLGHNGVRMINLTVIEGPSYGSQYGDQFDRAALWHGVYSALAAKHIPIAVIAPNTLKLWFTGNGAASKTDMTNAAMARFREPISTHDEADAVALATAGAFKLADPIPWLPNGRQLQALEKVEWPGPRIPKASTEHVGFRSGGPNG